jgi:hypothetical protein
VKRIDDLDRQLLMLAVLRLAITPDPLLSKRCFNVMKLLEGTDTTLFVESVRLGPMDVEKKANADAIPN